MIDLTQYTFHDTNVLPIVEDIAEDTYSPL